jgi:oligopeptide transport system substrate-binding protein
VRKAGLLIPGAAALCAAAVMLLSLPLQSGCSARERAVDVATREGVLLRGNLSEPKDLDPHVVTGVTEFNIISALLEGLVGENPVDLSPEPAAAERWTISDDGTVYTFFLRGNGRWSNGDPVTAGDFVFSFRRMLAPGMGSPYAYMLYGLKNAEAFHRGAGTNAAAVGAKALDSGTLELTLEAPVPHFLSLLAHHSWFPVHPPTVLRFGKADEIGTPWTQPGNYVGNGPFVLVAWKPGNCIEVRKNALYWDSGAVSLSGMRFYPIGDHKIEERAFLAGQLHITGTVPIDRIEYYRKNRPDILRLDPYLGTYYYLLNVTKPPFDDARVRRAFSMAVDREQIVRFITRGGEAPAFFFTPPDTDGYTCRSSIGGSIDEARRLLAEAGYPGGSGFPRVSVLFNTSEAHARIAQAVQQMWRQNLGVDVELLNMEWKVYLDQTQSLKFDVARAGWIGDYADPNSFLDMWVTGGGNNRTGWSNRDYDALIRQAAGTLDTSARMDLFQRAEAILLAEMPVIPLYFYRSKALIDGAVKGWNPTILDHHPYKHVSLSRP